MAPVRTAVTDLELRDVGFAALGLVAIALTVIAQLFSMIAFDETGLDVVVPDAVFVHLLPALALALVPAAVARRLYGRRVAIAAGAVVFVAVLAVSTYTVDFFALCGARC